MWSRPSRGAGGVPRWRRPHAPCGGHPVGPDDGNDPNLALSVPYRLGIPNPYKWEAGRSGGGGGHGPAAQGLGVVGEGGEETSSSSSSSGERTPPAKIQTQTPPKAPKKKPHHFESSEEEPLPPPSPDLAQGQAHPSGPN